MILNSMTLRELHRVILSSLSLHDAAQNLAVADETLQKHLSRMTYLDASEDPQPLSYEALKKMWPTEEDGEASWGERYDKLMNTWKVKLRERPLREIHSAILNSNSLREAATKLGVSDGTFQRYLSQSIYLEGSRVPQRLSYESLKKMWPTEEDGEAYWRERYDKPMNTRKVKLSERTLREIHGAILNSNFLNEAAINLAVADETLQNHLSQSIYFDGSEVPQRLSYDVLKKNWPTVKDAETYWDECYDKPMNITKVKLSERTLREIHRAVLNSSFLQDAAIKLGVNSITFKNYLSRATYLDARGDQQPLSYEALKKNWPTEEDGEASWRECYDRPMNTTKVELNEKALREIHRTVLTSNSLQDAAIKLGVAGITLIKHLSRATYLDARGDEQPLSYEVLKKNWPTEEDGEACWRERYDKPMNTRKVKLSERTFREIHCAILTSSSLHDAVQKLGVADDTLQRYLFQSIYLDTRGAPQRLSYDVLKENWPTEKDGEAYWRELYDKPMNTRKVKLSERTLREIHCVILTSTSLHDAVQKLGVADATLQNYLSQSIYLDGSRVPQPLSYRALKKNWPTEEDGEAYWRERYDKPMNTTKVKLNERTLREIHGAILTSTSLQDAASKLSVSDATLKKYLSQSIYLDASEDPQPLSYEALKKIWPTEEDGEAYWRERYDEPLSTRKVKLNERTLREIHGAILTSTSLQDAASKLSVSDATLKKYLSQSIYLDASEDPQPLSYEALKKIWPTVKDGEDYWGEFYDDPLSTVKVELSQRTPREIHGAILNSTSLRDAATKLGVAGITFKKHLSQSIYLDASGDPQPLSYEALKKIWPTVKDGEDYWGEFYDDPLSTAKVELSQRTLREIHGAILTSTSLEDAATKLGVAGITFTKHLSRSTYLAASGVQQRLSYEVLKKIWPTKEDGETYWGERYNRPLNSSKKISKNSHGFFNQPVQQEQEAVLQKRKPVLQKRKAGKDEEQSEGGKKRPRPGD